MGQNKEQKNVEEVRRQKQEATESNDKKVRK